MFLIRPGRDVGSLPVARVPTPTLCPWTFAGQSISAAGAEQTPTDSLSPANSGATLPHSHPALIPSSPSSLFSRAPGLDWAVDWVATQGS